MNQKIETVFNLALETTEEERALSDTLNVGFDDRTRTWEMIVKYNRSLEELVAQGIFVEELIAGYAILTVPENLVKQVVNRPEIEYAEMPKRFYFSLVGPTENGCIVQATIREPFLSGKGVLIAVLDSGIDYAREDFRNADGSSRVLFLWDQTLVPTEDRRPPEGFRMGVEFTGEQLVQEAVTGELLPGGIRGSIDTSGHGTAVAGIAAGRGPEYIGAAPQSDLLVVKLGSPAENGFPKTTEIMRAVTYVLNKARSLNRPLVINLSFGNNYGAHDGTSLLERFLDNAAEIGRTAICVGSGNEGNSAGHIAGRVSSVGAALREESVELAIAEYESSLNIQIWTNYSDIFQITVQSPTGESVLLAENIEGGKFTAVLENTKLLIYFGPPSPYSTDQEIYIDLIPQNATYIDSGVWRFLLRPIRIVTGQYFFYLSSSSVRNTNTGFLRPSPQVTLTVPSTASKVITVGAYDPIFDAYADFSGRGYADRDRILGTVAASGTKPDLVAAGVDVLAPDLYGGYLPVTGTSFATPIVSGAAALLMEWGDGVIIRLS